MPSCYAKIDSYIPSLRTVLLNVEKLSEIQRTTEIGCWSEPDDIKRYMRENEEKVERWIRENTVGNVSWGEYGRLEGLDKSVFGIINTTARKYVKIVDLLRSEFSKGDEMRVYREIIVPDDVAFIEDLRSGKIKQLGLYWSFTRTKAHAYWGGCGREQRRVRVGATTGCESIDYQRTIESYLIWTDYRRSEDEIRVLPGSEMHVFESCVGCAFDCAEPYVEKDCKVEDVVVRA